MPKSEHDDSFDLKKLEELKAARGFDALVAQIITPRLSARIAREQYRRDPKMRYLIRVTTEHVVQCVKRGVNPSLAKALKEG